MATASNETGSMATYSRKHQVANGQPVQCRPTPGSTEEWTRAAEQWKTKSMIRLTTRMTKQPTDSQQSGEYILQCLMMFHYCEEPTWLSNVRFIYGCSSLLLFVFRRPCADKSSPHIVRMHDSKLDLLKPSNAQQHSLRMHDVHKKWRPIHSQTIA